MDPEPTVTDRRPDEGPGPKPAFPAHTLWTLSSLIGVMASLLVVLAAPWLRDSALAILPPPSVGAMPERGGEQELLQRIDLLQRQVDRAMPVRPYLVVSVTDNTFRLMQRGVVLREGRCSTGSYIQLLGGDGRQWVFETPLGRRTVLGKVEKPVWVKPDWAFVEAGLPVPPPGSSARYERGVLGDYALALGDGYLIHGTLYQRLLGQPVTHGCIRLGDDDLRAVYQTLGLGSAVYIY